MLPTISIHSSPRFSTWIWIPDWRLLIDAGDGATQQLGYKIRKIDTVVVTHSHRDHIGGLLQVLNQRGEAGTFAVAHPCGSRSLPMIENFSHKFNPGSSRQAIWHKLEEGDEMPLVDSQRVLKAFRTRHYHHDEIANAPRSLGYSLIWRKQKVRPELLALSQKELDELRAEVGREGITSQVDEKWIVVGGDGEPLRVEDVRGAKLLLHEATFLSGADRDSGDEGDSGGEGEDVSETSGETTGENSDFEYSKSATAMHGHVHSTVEEALRVAQNAEVADVVLYHISTRYTDSEIRDAVRNVAKTLEFRGRVWPVLPRRVHWNLLAEKPTWEG